MSYVKQQISLDLCILFIILFITVTHFHLTIFCLASPIQIIERFPDDLPPISEEPPPDELATPECDQNTSPEVSIYL